MPDTFADVTFPEKGIDLGWEFAEQPALTTPVGRNVRTFEPRLHRGRGGSRAGLVKYVTDQVPAGSNLLQLLDYVVDPQNTALGLSWREGDDYVEDPSDGGRRRVRQGIRRIRVGGSGYYTHPEADQPGVGGGGEGIRLVQYARGTIEPDLTPPANHEISFDSDVMRGSLLLFVLNDWTPYANLSDLTTWTLDSTGFQHFDVAAAITRDTIGGFIPFRMQIWWAVAADDGPLTFNLRGVPGGFDPATGAGNWTVMEYAGTSQTEPIDDFSTNYGAFGGVTGFATTGGVPQETTGEAILGFFTLPFPNGYLTRTPGPAPNEEQDPEWRNASDGTIHVTHAFNVRAPSILEGDWNPSVSWGPTPYAWTAPWVAIGLSIR